MLLRWRERQRERAEERLEAVLFETIEIDLKRLGVGACAEACFARFGGETIVVDSNIAQERNFPLFAWNEVDKCLIIEVFRVVFSFAFEGAEQARIALETESV